MCVCVCVCEVVCLEIASPSLVILPRRNGAANRILMDKNFLFSSQLSDRAIDCKTLTVHRFTRKYLSKSPFFIPSSSLPLSPSLLFFLLLFRLFRLSLPHCISIYLNLSLSLYEKDRKNCS